MIQPITEVTFRAKAELGGLGESHFGTSSYLFLPFPSPSMEKVLDLVPLNLGVTKRLKAISST